LCFIKKDNKVCAIRISNVLNSRKHFSTYFTVTSRYKLTKQLLPRTVCFAKWFWCACMISFCTQHEYSTDHFTGRRSACAYKQKHTQLCLGVWLCLCVSWGLYVWVSASLPVSVCMSRCLYLWLIWPTTAMTALHCTHLRRSLSSSVAGQIFDCTLDRRWNLPTTTSSFTLTRRMLSGTWVSDHVSFWTQLDCISPPLCSDACLEDKREDSQNCSVLCCVRHLWTMIYTHTWAGLTFMHVWFRFLFVCLFRFCLSCVLSC